MSILLTELATPRNLFDYVAAHLVAQGFPALADGTEVADCVYLNQFTGARCAVGCLVSREHYNSDMEEEGIVHRHHHMTDGPALVPVFAVSSRVEASIGRKLTQKDLVVLSKLQQFHDGSDGPFTVEGLDKLEARLLKEGIL